MSCSQRLHEVAIFSVSDYNSIDDFSVIINEWLEDFRGDMDIISISPVTDSQGLSQIIIHHLNK